MYSTNTEKKQFHYLYTWSKVHVVRWTSSGEKSGSENDSFWFLVNLLFRGLV